MQAGRQARAPAAMHFTIAGAAPPATAAASSSQPSALRSSLPKASEDRERKKGGDGHDDGDRKGRHGRALSLNCPALANAPQISSHHVASSHVRSCRRRRQRPALWRRPAEAVPIARRQAPAAPLPGDLLAHPGIAGIVVAIHPAASRDLYDAATAGIAKLLPPVAGGATRQAFGAERAGTAGRASAPDYVLIHDAARPLSMPGPSARTIAALGASRRRVLVAVPVVDTIKRGVGRAGRRHGRPARSVARANAAGLPFPGYPGGTPQASPARELTDDAAVAEAAGIPVIFSTGSERNFKVTTQDDMERAERMIGSHDWNSAPATASTCTADRRRRHHHVRRAHRLRHGAGGAFRRRCRPACHHRRLLGAIGAKDIGAHFPPSDPTWRGAESWKFLDHADGWSRSAADGSSIATSPSSASGPRSARIATPW